MRAIRTRAREVLQSLHGIVWRFKSTKLAKSKLAQDGGSSAGVVVNGVDSLGGYQHSSLRQSARLTLLRTFWVQAVQIILLFLLQAVFAEDISLSMNRANVNVSWFMGLLNVSSQLLLASISMSQQQHQKQKQQQEQQQQQQQQQQQGGEQQQQPVSQYMPLFNAKGDQPLAQTRQALLVYYLHSFLARYRWEYFVSSVAVVLFQVLNNYSTFLIAYNTVQLFMASKVAFVMAASALLVGRRYSYQAYFYCAVLVTGLYLLSQADLGSSSHASQLVSDLGTSAGPSEQIALDGNAGTREQLGETRSSDVAVEAVIRSMWGFTMTFISMVCISVHAIVQESVLQGRSIKAAACCAQLYRRLRRRAQEQFSSLPMRRQSPDISALMVRDELIFYTNIITLCLLLIGVAVSGDFHKGVAFFVAAPRRLLYEQIIVLLISSFGQRQVLKLAQEFGSTSATIVVTIRKCITFGISVLIFPKPVTYTHIAALGLISLSACSLQMCLLNDEATQQSIQQTKSSPTTDLLSSTDNASRGGSSHTQLSFSTARSRFGAMRSGSTPFEV